MPSEAQSVDRFLPAAAIETSRRPGSVALALAAGGIQCSPLSTQADPAGAILPALDRLVRAAGLEPGALRLIVLGAGPGSFTGLRAGAAVAAVLARFLPAPLVALPSLEGSPLLLRTGNAALCLDALRGQVFGAFYLEGRQVSAPALLSPEEFAARLARFAPAGEGFLGGDGLGLLDARCPGSAGWSRTEEEWEPRADLLLRRALDRAARGEFTAPEELEPLYLRAAAAEEARSARETRS